jgi:hypothetical protein
MPRRKTNEEFIKEVFDLVGSEYKFIEEYRNSNTKITVLHISCDREYSVTPANFLSGYRCPHCSKEKREVSYDELKKRVIEIHGDIYDFLSEYRKLDVHIEIRHKHCGYSWETLPSSLIDKRKKEVVCPNCNDRIKITTEELRNRINRTTDEYELIGEYTSKKKIVLHHHKCNEKFTANAHDFLRNPRCPVCDGTKKHTHEQVVNRIIDLFGDEYTLLSTYINSATKVRIRHNNSLCEYKEFLVTPNEFFNGGRTCPVCNKVRRRESSNSHDEFVSKVENLVGRVYRFLSKYQGTKNKIRFVHIDCGFEMETRANDILQSAKKGKIPCLKCNNRIPMTEEEFANYLKEVSNNEYTLVSEFIDRKTHVQIKHLACGRIYSVKPQNFISGSRCRECYFQSRRKTDEQFKQDIRELEGNNYEVVTTYKNATTKVMFKHNICGNVFSSKPSDFLSGRRCPKCSQKSRIQKATKTHELFLKEAILIHGDDYDFLSKYENSQGKMTLKHKECGYTWETDVATILRKRYKGKTFCPLCGSMPKGEELICNILSSNNVYFVHQYKFDDCVNILPLPFDFAVFNDRGRIKCLIEFDGQQHFNPIGYFGGQRQFEEQIKKDRIKNEYCRKNNIKLIRIPYWEECNLESILDKIINDKPYEVDKTSFLITL